MKRILGRIILYKARTITFVIVLFANYTNAQDFKLANVKYANVIIAAKD